MWLATASFEFRTIAKIYGAESPEILLLGSKIIAGVMGTAQPRERGGPPAFLTFTIVGGEAMGLSTCIERSWVPARLAANGDRFFALSQQYLSPVESALFIGLRVNTCRDAHSEVLTREVPGTERQGTYPHDYAIHAETSGRIHVIYEGVRDEAGAPASRLWDVVIDATGELVAEQR